MTAFARYIGIDYSGAGTPAASLKGLRVYMAEGEAPPEEVLPPPGSRKYWNRKGIAHWPAGRLSEDTPTLAGIDHGFSFPLAYFERHGLAHDWPQFLDDFQRHWPADADATWVRDIREGRIGNGRARNGDRTWLRPTEMRTKTAKSVFDFDRKQGNVAFSTHAGIPWLRFLRRELGGWVHFWPFDGWHIPGGSAAIAEAYPALYSHYYDREDRTGDQHDAYSIAAWMQQTDRDGRLAGFLNLELTPEERSLVRLEGWILGVA